MVDTGDGFYTGLEYTLNNEGGEWPENTEEMYKHGSPHPLTWQTFNLEFPDPSPIGGGYYILIRYYEKTITSSQPIGQPIGNPVKNVSIVYPNYTIRSQFLERNEDKKYFEVTNEHNLFDAPAPKEYTVTDPAFAGINEMILAPALPPNPITDPPVRVANQYSYCRIFDQSKISWYPRLSSDKQTPLEAKNATIPSEPYFPQNNPPVYPIDAITSFIPDEREIVNVTYKLTTYYTVLGVEHATSVIITHPISQSEISTSNKLKGTMEKSYYENGYVHQGLYPPNTEAIYDSEGRLLEGAKINEPFNIKQLTRKTYPYDKNTLDWRPYPEQ